MLPELVERRRAGGRRPVLRAVPDHPLRVVDVALWYGARSGGIRTYLDAKLAWAATEPGIEHHLVVPGPVERHEGGRHELPSFAVAPANGYRFPYGPAGLVRTLRLLRPDVVLLHDPFWGPRQATEAAQRAGAHVVAVHHGSAELDAAALPGPRRLEVALLRRWMRHATEDVDAVMSAVDPEPDLLRPPDVPLRFGLHPAFVPQHGVRRGAHVLFAGRLSREKGAFRLLEALARARRPWPLRLVGDGPARDALARHARRLGLAGRVTFHPYIADQRELARAYAGAAAVVMPGEHETFGLVAFEAAASGANVVLCETAPSAAHVGALGRTFRAGDTEGLARAIGEACDAPRDPAAAAALARRSTWPAVLARELEDLRRLLR